MTWMNDLEQKGARLFLEFRLWGEKVWETKPAVWSGPPARRGTFS